jgi:hypothetical protein
MFWVQQLLVPAANTLGEGQNNLQNTIKNVKLHKNRYTMRIQISNSTIMNR